MGVVQGKVTAINMLILKSFLKSTRAKIGGVLQPLFRPNRDAKKV
jgi:hypothetical protein